jgi:hypothetical protein
MQLRATVLGSALSGMIARIPCHPMDTVKARLQAQGSPMSSGAAALPVTPQYHSARHALMSIWGQEGLKGLYRGFGVTFCGISTCYDAVFYYVRNLQTEYGSWQLYSQ